METDYFLALVTAFVRGKLLYTQHAQEQAQLLLTKELNELSDSEMDVLMQIGKEHNLRLHRFKKSMELLIVARI